jgi:hypothetical protein
MPRGIATFLPLMQRLVVATRPTIIVPPAVFRVGSPLTPYLAITALDAGDFGPSPTPLTALTA